MKLLQPLLSNLVLASTASAGIFPGNIRIFRRQDGAETTISFFPGPTTVTVFLEATTATSIEDSDTVLLVSGTTTSWTADVDRGNTSQRVPVDGTAATLTILGTSVDITLTESITAELSLAGLATN